VTTRFWLRPLIAVITAALVGCSGAPGVRTSSLPPRWPEGVPTGIPTIPDGTYTATISFQDAEQSGNSHLVNLASELTGRYELTLHRGAYTLTRDGKRSVPTPVARRTGGEGAYGRYGFWLFLGVPPIGQGIYAGDSAQIAFRSEQGACFQKGVRSTLTTGVYRFSYRASSLTLQPVKAQGPTPSSNGFAGKDGCLGRAFVLTAHPWTRQG
jgi:hypothetical protein